MDSVYHLNREALNPGSELVVPCVTSCDFIPFICKYALKNSGNPFEVKLLLGLSLSEHCPTTKSRLTWATIMSYFWRVKGNPVFSFKELLVTRNNRPSALAAEKEGREPLVIGPKTLEMHVENFSKDRYLFYRKAREDKYEWTIYKPYFNAIVRQTLDDFLTNKLENE